MQRLILGLRLTSPGSIGPLELACIAAVDRSEAKDERRGGEVSVAATFAWI